MADIGRNEPCPCGSGKKYKKCCMEKLINIHDSNLFTEKNLQDYEKLV